jgi:hypothetical protein
MGSPLLKADDAARMVFAQGAFESADEDGLPLGWRIEDWRQEGKITVVKEETGNHFLRIANDEGKSWPRLSATFKLPPDWKAVHLQARLRAQSMKLMPGWSEARIGYYLLDENHKELSSGTIAVVTKDTKWRRFAAHAVVPGKAAFLKIQPSLISITGTVDFDDIRIEKGTATSQVLTERMTRLANTPLAPANDLPIPPLEPLTPAALSQLIGSSPLVTLHYKEAPAQTVIKDLARQAACDIRLFAEDTNVPWPAVTLDAEKQPFWDVVTSLAGQLKVQVKSFLPVPQMVLYRSGDGKAAPELAGPTMDAGLVRLVINKAERVQATPDQPGEANITISVLLDPRLRPLSWGVLLPASDKGDASTFRPMSASVPIYQNGWPVRVGNSSLATFTAPVALRAGDDKRIGKVAGTLRFQVVTRSEKWEIAAPLKIADSSKTVEVDESGVQSRLRLVINEVQPHGDNYLVWFSFQKPAPLRFGQLSGIESVPAFRLIDDRGRALYSTGTPSLQRLGTTTAYVREFSPFHPLTSEEEAGIPVRLEVQVPTKVKTIEVPFEFKDVPLLQGG